MKLAVSWALCYESFKNPLVHLMQLAISGAVLLINPFFVYLMKLAISWALSYELSKIPLCSQDETRRIPVL